MQDFHDKTEAQDDRSFAEGREVGRKTMAYSIVSLILSLMSLVCCCTGAISLVFGVLAIVFAVLSRRHLGYFDTMALVGLIVGIIGTVFGGSVVLADLFAFRTPFEDIDATKDFGVSF